MLAVSHLRSYSGLTPVTEWRLTVAFPAFANRGDTVAEVIIEHAQEGRK